MNQIWSLCALQTIFSFMAQLPYLMKNCFQSAKLRKSQLSHLSETNQKSQEEKILLLVLNMDQIHLTTMILIQFHPTFVQTSKSVHGQDLHCHLTLLWVLLVHNRHYLTLVEEEDQIAYFLHQEHEDLDYHQECVDHLWVD